MTSLMAADDALARVLAAAAPVAETETVPVVQAVGRVLPGPLAAPMALPPHDNAALDGYALRGADLVAGGETRLAVAGRVLAGQVATAPPPGAALRIFTGAPVPPGLDTVVAQEVCRRDGDHVILPAGTRPAANVRKAGEDVAPGQMALPAGRRLGPADIALAAALGVAALTVVRRLRVAVFSTGNEVFDAGTPLAPGAIHDANRPMLRALLAGLGAEVADLGIVADDADSVTAALAGARGHDLVLTSGGVSVGAADHVRAAVEALGAVDFWKLAIRPGKPLAFGRLGATPFFGLPGNPAAALITFVMFVRPFLLRRAGVAEVAAPGFQVPLATDLTKRPGLREWRRGRLVDGRARVTGVQGSGILSSLAEAEGLIELPEAASELPAGTMIAFRPFSGLLG